MPTPSNGSSTKEASGASTKTLENLFHDSLKDIYYAEKRS